MGRGTTPLEAFLRGCRPLGNDINPLSRALLEPRLTPPTLDNIAERLDSIDLTKAKESFPSLEVFFHSTTLRQIIALKEYLLKREQTGALAQVDRWIRMVAINRLTGHSPGFFSVYSLPPNQAVSIEAQAKINKTRQQTPEPKDIVPRILRRSKSLLKDWTASAGNDHCRDLNATLTTEEAHAATGIPSGVTQLVVTSPPFLDVVDYQADNWMRCWFLNIDSSTINIAQLRRVEDWQLMVTNVMKDLHRVLRPGGYVAFEVGEIRNGTLLLEELVLPSHLM